MSTEYRKILLIDDDRLQYRLTQEQFKNFHAERFDLEWASNYEDGLAQLMSGTYAACLLDFRLGERDGLQLIHQAMAAGCHTPIVFLTAETAERVDIAAMNAGALDYLVKGEITPRLLERSLRYALKLGDTLEELRLLATHDQLTGLFNRREFDRILAEESDRALRFGRPLALILVDIDHFKKVNDTHGHLIGDEVLREVARRLAGDMRSVDRVTRFGGEEFALVVMETDQAAALGTARRICAAMAQTPVVTVEKLTLPVTISAGVAVLPGDASTCAALVSAADRALYTAKARGRNQAVAFPEL
jgi:two-component system, cell cycle response regulator